MPVTAIFQRSNKIVASDPELCRTMVHEAKMDQGVSTGCRQEIMHVEGEWRIARALILLAKHHDHINVQLQVSEGTQSKVPTEYMHLELLSIPPTAVSLPPL